MAINEGFDNSFSSINNFLNSTKHWYVASISGNFSWIKKDNVNICIWHAKNPFLRSHSFDLLNQYWLRNSILSVSYDDYTQVDNFFSMSLQTPLIMLITAYYCQLRPNILCFEMVLANLRIFSILPSTTFSPWTNLKISPSSWEWTSTSLLNNSINTPERTSWSKFLGLMYKCLVIIIFCYVDLIFVADIYLFEMKWIIMNENLFQINWHYISLDFFISAC